MRTFPHLRMLSKLSDKAEIVIVISALDIEKNKVRNDLGITYDMDVLRLREEFIRRGFMVGSVVITHYNGQSSADAYREKLRRMGITVYYHYTIEGYPTNVDLIDSDEGFGRNDYVVTSRPLVIVTAPGPGSGKMAVCLSQLSACLSYIRSTSAESKPDMPSSRLSPYGACRSNILST